MIRSGWVKLSEGHTEHLILTLPLGWLESLSLGGKLYGSEQVVLSV